MERFEQVRDMADKLLRAEATGDRVTIRAYELELKKAIAEVGGERGEALKRHRLRAGGEGVVYFLLGYADGRGNSAPQLFEEAYLDGFNLGVEEAGEGAA